MPKVRLDTALVERKLCRTRAQARSAIMAGLVYVDGRPATKAGQLVAPEARLELRGDPCPYVSRGGYKLAKALRAFGVDLTGRVVLDVGASTGGFTDCALQHGARLVYAVDVGYGQLAWRLRCDPRVVVLERTNIRKLEPARLDPRPDFATVDVSFISLKLVIPRLEELLVPEGEGIALVKPQFEAGRSRVGKRGVVRDPAVHVEVLQDLVVFLTSALGWGVKGLDFSPLKGPEGNIEYLLYFSKQQGGRGYTAGDLAALVAEAHLVLAKGVDRL